MNELEEDRLAWSRRQFLVGASAAAAGAALWSSAGAAAAAPGATGTAAQAGTSAPEAGTTAQGDGLVAVSDGFAAGWIDRGQLRLHRSPDGATWTDTGGSVPVGEGGRLSAMWGQGDGLAALVAAGTTVSLFTAVDGRAWQPEAVPDGLFAGASPITALGVGATALVLGTAVGGDGAEGRPGLVAWIRSASGAWDRTDGLALEVHGSVVDAIGDPDGTITALVSDSTEMKLFRSRDLLTWDSLTLPGSVGHAAATMVRDRQSGDVHVTGARVDDPTTSSVWSWPSGTDAPGPWGSTRMHLSAHSVSAARHVAIGEDASFRRAVWTSPDAITWTPATVA